MTDRIDLATERPWVVVNTAGLLADFNDAGVVNPLDVTSAQTIARVFGETDEKVLLAAALTVRGTRYGHVCIRLDTVRDAVVVDGQDPEEIEQLPWPNIDEWTGAVAASPLVGNGTGREPLALEDGRLYLQRYHHYEQRVADLLVARLSTGSGPPLADGKWGRAEPGVRGDHAGAPEAGATIPLWTDEPPGDIADTRGEGIETEALAPASRALLVRLLDPSTRQYAAARLALTARVAIIAGGPGTGKTYTIAATLAALATSDDFPNVAVCAPTGKAAARLGEAIASMASELGDDEAASRLSAVEPSTIHRLLGWSWDRGKFAHDGNNRLAHDMVIVDEMSMVSLPMTAKLLDAVRDDATVVLVGDPDQLESIEAGTVLGDIVGAAEGGDAAITDHVVVLDRVHRFEEDSDIADLAEAVRSGGADAVIDQLRGTGGHIGWAEDRRSPEFGEVWDRVVDQRVRMVELASEGRGDEALATLRELAVLCARRSGPQGVSGWGREIEGALDERFTGLRWGGDWYPGRPVMITKNDYTQDLYNGDIGVCVKTADGMRVLFDRDGGREFLPSHLGQHTTVHAMTIHKSQGSQFDEVVVVLPAESSRLLTRELLYTAVTRARTRVNIIGAEDVVRAAVERSVQRASGLGVRLGQA
jgi:exodeoxyribonuclease V alpha subunit